MDKLNEPEFANDKVWKRKLLGVDEKILESTNKQMIYFGILASAACYRYLREILYYQKNFPQAAVVLPLFVASSYYIAKYLTEDPFVTAAKINNDNELDFISKYGELYKLARKESLEIKHQYLY